MLSKFGLVPAAAMGLDVRRLLETTRTMQRSCGADVPPAENPGVQLGVAMGVAATRFGRDKVTIIASPGIADLGAWLEQLLAESTGKQGRGLIPLAGEPLTAPERYGSDRFFAYLELDGQIDPSQRQAVEALERAGHPVARISVKDVWHIGQEFFRWEIATAVAGSIIGIDPFNQPDVEASKDKTRALTDAYEKSHRLPEEAPVFRENGVALYADPRNAAELGRHNTLAGYLKSHFGRVHAGASRRLRGAARLYRAQRGAHASPDRDAHAHPRQDPRRDLPRLRTALPAFDRASLQRRPEFRRVPAGHLRRPGRHRRARPFLQLWRRQGGAGAAAISRCWWNATGARCAFTSRMSMQGLTELARAIDAALE